jgi:UDP-galactopyranose mutase
MNKNIDLVVIGAGLSGCVIAERAAKILNWKVLILERRNHIAGNCFDKYMENGLLIHQYGPHYFRTNNSQLVDYLSQFTSWIEGNYIVKSSFNNHLFPFPINLDTLEQFYGQTLIAETAKELLDEKREKINKPVNSEEFVLSKVGREMYEAFYLNYTLKQWGKHPKELDTTVCGRIPIRFNRDNRYVEHQYQIIPKNGYTAMIQKMIENPNIQIMLNMDYKELNLKDCKAIVYTGAIDEYFDYSLGRLPWRSLNFKYKEFDQEYVQPCVQINYPNEHDYTRSVEIKHVTKQVHPKTIVAYEYPTATGEPYYPIPAPENRALYEQYKKLAERETIENYVYFVGRLAGYAYLNMDEVIERALSIFDEIKKNCKYMYERNE